MCTQKGVVARVWYQGCGSEGGGSEGGDSEGGGSEGGGSESVTVIERVWLRCRCSRNPL